MALARTDLRNTRESAKRIRFERASGLQATNVQDAISEAAAQPVVITPTTVGATPYNVLNTDTVLYVDTSIGPVTINLQPAAGRGGRPLEIYDVTGNAAANPISLVPSGAETVDGQAPFPIDMNYGGVNLYPKAAGGYKQAT